MFVDEVRVFAKAGRGGNGCVAFLREPFKPKGGPAGGDGGRGGDVVLVADENVQDFTAQFYEPHLIAENGGHGKGKKMNGRKGRDLIVRVPCGTVVWRIRRQVKQKRNGLVQEEYLPAGAVKVLSADGEEALFVDLENASEGQGPAERMEWHQVEEGEELEFVADLTEHGQRLVLCKGGRGGRGNQHFATPENQAPRYAEPGQPGEEGYFLLELRLIADVGLVGYPNAGKSSLLAALTNARPKIAPYPFTTLHPNIGVLEYEDWFRVRLCDVPGLIEGAHQNVGLGYAFLRHIRRCKVLLYVLDTAGTEGRTPWEDLQHLKNELGHYDPELLKRPAAVVANKIDLVSAIENLEYLRRAVGHNIPIVPVSATEGTGLERLRQLIRALVESGSQA